MRFDFFDKFGIAGFSPEESSHTAEFLHNNDPENNNDGLIDWSYWSELSNITPTEAAHLLHAVDVDVRDDADTPLPRQKMQDGLQKDIDKLARWLSSKSPSWSLQQLVDTFGAENLNTRLVAAVKVVAVDDTPTKKSVAHVEWLRETWIKEGRLGGADFFIRLKRYKNAVDSPIADHWTHSTKGAGAKVRLIDGTTKDITKKTILNMVSTFNKQSQKTMSIDETA
jgi:hypothetical protein